MRNKSNILKIGGKNLDLENWKVYHPNGRHMFTCGGKKAKWYLKRNLAVEIGNFEIKFTFEPKGYGFADNEEFGRVIREAKCVVTGVDYDLQRHHIVPYCYRSQFPEKYKSKNHHDVVLINQDKHAEYELKATEFKDVLAERYGVDTISDYNKEYSLKLREFNKNKTHTLSRINALFKGFGNLSEETIYTNLKFISENTGLTVSFLKKCTYIQLYKLYCILQEEYTRDLYEFKGQNANLYDHGWHLVQKLNTDTKVVEFVKLWRTHFIETMNPQFMPDGWSINFRHKTRV